MYESLPGIAITIMPGEMRCLLTKNEQKETTFTHENFCLFSKYSIGTFTMQTDVPKIVLQVFEKRIK